MSAIASDGWCYASRLALEELGWSLDDERYEPDDVCSVLECEEVEDGLISITDPLRADSEGITVCESLWTEVRR
jgi:hypothetical protein